MLNPILLFFTDYLAYLLVIYALYQFVKKKDKKMLWVPLISLLLSSLISNFSGVPRPFTVSGNEPLIPHAADGSFPSDHSSLVFGIAISQSSILVWFFATLVAVSRVYAKLHWPLDITGSFVLVLLVNWVWTWYFRKKTKTPN